MGAPTKVTRVVVMGPSDAAVALTGAGVAARLRARYVDGRELRPRTRPRLRRGGGGGAAGDAPARSEAERWFDALCVALAAEASVVVTTGALTRQGRDALRAAVGGVVFVELVTQTAPAEPLLQDETGFRVADDADLPAVVDRVVELLAGR